MKIHLAFTTKLGFYVSLGTEKIPLVSASICKITSKFVDGLLTSPYFAAYELHELSSLSRSLELEDLKRHPNTGPLVDKIVVWFAKSQLRQNQLKEWLRSAPELFVCEILRAQNFDVTTQS